MARLRPAGRPDPVSTVRRAVPAVSAALLMLVTIGGAGFGAASASPTTSAPPSSPSPIAPAPDAEPAYRDPSLPVEARVDDLLRRMSLAEEVGQMTQAEKDSVTPELVRQARLGGVLSGGGGSPVPNTPEAWYAMVETYQDAALSTPLGIPMLYGVDAVHGHGNLLGATIFPHQVGLGAAADPDLAERIGRATAEELAATGIRWDFGPVIAVPQDVRWGRTYEGYGQDPALVGRIGSAYLRGLQGSDLTDPASALGTAKHYLGDGGTAWGTSTTDTYRIDQGVTTVDEATLRQIHLAPYRDMIAAGVRVVMASFSSWRDGKVHGDRYLLTDVLKTELGFSGFVVSDWGGVDQVDPTDYDAAVVRSIEAGIDMVMVPYDVGRFQRALTQAVVSGALPMSRIDDAVRRILRVKFEAGLFETPMPPADQVDVVGSAEHRALAREAVAASMTLLATTPGALPLERSGTLLVAGYGADDIGLQSGGWTITWQGRQGAITPGTTILDAITAAAGTASVRYSATGRFGDPAGAAASPVLADTAIVVVAEPPYAEGLGDSARLALPIGSDAIVARVRPLARRLVLIVLSGRPVILGPMAQEADAIIAAWLPGTEGSGVADVLFGERPFTGRTPYAWPATPSDAPRTGKAPCDGVIWPAGFGLAADGTRLGVAPCGGG